MVEGGRTHSGRHASNTKSGATLRAKWFPLPPPLGNGPFKVMKPRSYPNLCGREGVESGKTTKEVLARIVK